MTGIEELAKAIDEAGSRAAFAERAEISESYLSNILSGRKPFARVPVETAVRIAEAAGISVERLAATEDAPEVTDQ